MVRFFKILRARAQRYARHRPKRQQERHYRPQLEILEDRLTPANHVWSGAFSDLWLDPRNWSSGGSPAGDPNPALVFPSSFLRLQSTDDLPGQTNIAGMAIYGERYQIGAVPASSLRLGGDPTDQNGFGSNANSLNLPIALGPGQWNVGPGTAVTLNMTGPVFDSPGFTNLTKTGTGVLVLAPQNRNSYSGETIINQGTLRPGNANALPLGTTVVVNQGGPSI